MDLPRRYNSNCSSASPCRSEIEASYSALDLETAPSSSSQRPSSSFSSFPSPISSDSIATSPIMRSNYGDPLRTLQRNPRIAKTADHHHHNLHQQAATYHRNTDRLQQHAQVYHGKSHHGARSPHIPHVDQQAQFSPIAQQYRSEDEQQIAHNEQHMQELHHGYRHQQHEHQQFVSDAARLRSSSPLSPRSRPAFGPRRPYIFAGPRSATSEQRLPSLFAQLRAKLEAPKRPTITTSSLPPPMRSMDRSLSQSAESEVFSSTLAPLSPFFNPQPTTPRENQFMNGNNNRPWQPLQPTMFGIPCSSASQRAYSNHNSDIERSFLRLQREDSGRLEHRTIAFSTHLTVSRWEPAHASSTSTSTGVTVPNTSSSSASSLSSSGVTSVTTVSSLPTDAQVSDKSRSDNNNIAFRGSSVTRPSSPHSPASPKQLQQEQQYEQSEQQQQHQQKNDPVYAARLMSLANYIRHIISLSCGNSPLHSQLALVQQHKQQAFHQQQQKMQQSRPAPYTLVVQSTYDSSHNQNNSTNAAIGGTGRPNQAAASLPSPLSAGPGPIKSNSLSTRRHRLSSEYHDHQVRRAMHHQQQQQEQQHQQQQSSAQGQHDAEQQEAPQQSNAGFLYPPETQVYRLPSPTSPTFFVGRRLSQQQQQQQQQQQHNAVVSPHPSTVKPFSPLLKVPFPNLTLTLALIYVDRLKAKYPEAKGEPGCSHRLFLVAYIIAAKYRCSVELAALLQEHNNHIQEREARDLDSEDGDHNSNSSHSTSRKNSMPFNSIPNHEQLNDKSTEQRLWEARTQAELMFSNHEWVRLLSLGSFFRPPPPLQTSSAGAGAGTTAGGDNVTARTSPTQPMVRSVSSAAFPSLKPEPKPLPIQSLPSPLDVTPALMISSAPSGVISPAATDATLSGDTRNVSTTNLGAAKNPLVPTQVHTSAPVPAPASILQAEDLDRMETEFLTFLDFDLSTKSQDLDTCWNLLIGNKEV